MHSRWECTMVRLLWETVRWSLHPCTFVTAQCQIYKHFHSTPPPSQLKYLTFPITFSGLERIIFSTHRSTMMCHQGNRRLPLKEINQPPVLSSLKTRLLLLPVKRAEKLSPGTCVLIRMLAGRHM